jgi:hypothetical protein
MKPQLNKKRDLRMNCNMWQFEAYKSSLEFILCMPFHVQQFDDYDDMKTFEKEHANENSDYTGYHTNYFKVN